MQTIAGSIYDWPKYYEFIYGSDWRAEVEFLQDCFQRYVNPGAVQRLFEPACGTGRLIFRLAKCGYQVSGADINARAVAFCNKRLSKNGLPPSAFVADICDFSLDGVCDAAFNTINSFRHLETDEKAEAHLRCMASALRPGGIYVLGLHLTPTIGVADESESWSQRRGHLQVNASMWLEARDLANRRETFNMAFDVYTPSKQFRIRDQFHFRTYTAAQFQELIDKMADFDISDVFDFAYQIDKPLSLDHSTEDAVFILTRK